MKAVVLPRHLIVFGGLLLISKLCLHTSLALMISTKGTLRSMLPKSKGNDEVDNEIENLETTTLPKLFGHEKFRPGQKAVIKNILLKKSCLAILPTGMLIYGSQHNPESVDQ